TSAAVVAEEEVEHRRGRGIWGGAEAAVGRGGSPPGAVESPPEDAALGEAGAPPGGPDVAGPPGGRSRPRGGAGGGGVEGDAELLEHRQELLRREVGAA